MFVILDDRKSYRWIVCIGITNKQKENEQSERKNPSFSPIFFKISILICSQHRHTHKPAPPFPPKYPTTFIPRTTLTLVLNETSFSLSLGSIKTWNLPLLLLR